jgi:hypothetical protein
LKQLTNVDEHNHSSTDLQVPALQNGLLGGDEASDFSERSVIALAASIPSLQEVHRFELEVGDIVEVVGRRKYPQLNGTMGKVLTITRVGRAHVRILTGVFKGATLKEVGPRKLRPVVLELK